MSTSLIIHGHFYQPPRENPWTDMVDREAGAHPHHDWNERIHAECYRPNAFARIVDGRGRVEQIVNNYEHISFNFGPTLLGWLERHHPETYRRVLEADRLSAGRRGGHGNAIAQGYNHAILPLCNQRDRRTQVRWGLADFRRRFGREPASLWLPETACNDATLGTLIDEGLAYVILSPHQAGRVRPLGAGDDAWRDVGDGRVDPGVAYRYFHRDGSGRSIALFFYDGHLAKAVAFEGALASAGGLVDRFERAGTGEGRVVQIATDGESYGHHFKFGDRCLAFALEHEAVRRGFRVTNYGEYLERHPPEWEAEIRTGDCDEGTAWSCVHGLGRWSRDCGCHTGAQEGWHQRWRGPLRAAFDHLRDEAAAHFAATAGDLFIDPWAARDDYVELLIDPARPREEFLGRHAPRPLSADQRVRALTFLDLQRASMLMYTSCGWFFADVSGLETVQGMRYAGLVLDLMDDLGLPSPRERFLEILAGAESNLPEMGNGADVYRRFVGGARVPPAAVAANLAMSALVERQDGEAGDLAGYRFRRQGLRRNRRERLRLATGRLRLEKSATGREYDYAFAAMHFGGTDFYCLLKDYVGDAEFARAAGNVWEHFGQASLPTMLRLAQAEFGGAEFGLEHVLPEGRERIARTVFRGLVRKFAEEYATLYRDNRWQIETLQQSGFEPPAELRAAAEFTLARQFEEEIRRQHQSKDPAAYRKAMRIAQDAARHGYRLAHPTSRRVFEEMITGAVRVAAAEPAAENIEAALALMSLAARLGIEADLERAQEAVYAALRRDAVRPAGLDELALKVGLSPALLARGNQPVGGRRPLLTPEPAAAS